MGGDHPSEPGAGTGGALGGVESTQEASGGDGQVLGAHDGDGGLETESGPSVKRAAGDGIRADETVVWWMSLE